MAIARQFPKAFAGMNVQRLAASYRALMDGIKRMCPEGENARIALLTPGPYNETYFEHAYLARYLGLTLVEGNDLTVRDQRLYLKTLSGLEPVHALIKRLDDEWLDPLELRSDSRLGVPGLLQVLRAGNLLLANACRAPRRWSPARCWASCPPSAATCWAKSWPCPRWPPGGAAKTRRCARCCPCIKEQRDQAHLPALGPGHRDGPEPERARTRRMVRPHGPPPRRLHRAVVAAAVANARPGRGERRHAALIDAARLCAGRRPAAPGVCCPAAWCGWHRVASS